MSKNNPLNRMTQQTSSRRLGLMLVKTGVRAGFIKLPTRQVLPPKKA